MHTRRRPPSKPVLAVDVGPAPEPRSVLDDIFLRALVRDIVRGSLVASLGVAAGGCDSFPLIDASFVEPTCRDGQWDGLSAIQPAQPLDAIAWRSATSDGVVNDTALSGDPCSQASDREACDLAWDAAGVEDESVGKASRGFGIPGREYIVVNRGDAVETVGDRAELVELLGAIDTEDEAITLAFWDYYSLHCGDRTLSSARPGQGGFLVVGTKLTSSCAPVEATRYMLRVTEDGRIEERDSEVYSSQEGLCIGRVPHGLCSRADQHGRLLGDYFAQAAHLEAASVIAFEVLADELAAHDAPAELIALSRRFARDEARHTQQVAKLARRFGGDVKAPVVRKHPVRSLEAIALENAVEGCVRETYGALLGAYQAATATDMEIATCMRSIAGDEAQHACLSHALEAWLTPKLSIEARERVASAKRAAFIALRAEVGKPSASILHDVAGVPRPSAALRLLDALAEPLA